MCFGLAGRRKQFGWCRLKHSLGLETCSQFSVFKHQFRSTMTFSVQKHFAAEHCSSQNCCYFLKFHVETETFTFWCPLLLLNQYSVSFMWSPKHKPASLWRTQRLEFPSVCSQVGENARSWLMLATNQHSVVFVHFWVSHRAETNTNRVFIGCFCCPFMAVTHECSVNSNLLLCAQQRKCWWIQSALDISAA